MVQQDTSSYHGMKLSEQERAFLGLSTARMTDIDQSALNDKTIKDARSSGVRKNQERALRRWYIYVAGHPGASVDNVKSLEGFMLMVSTGVQGRKGDDYYFNEWMSEEESEEGEEEPRASYQTARNIWNNFCAACRWNGHPVSPDHMKHMTKFIQNIVKKFAKLRPAARERKFASDFHFGLLAAQLFRRDWVIYRAPGTRVVDMAIRSANFQGSARVGEFVLSSARDDLEGRGLYFKEVHMFAMFNKDKGKTELCIRFSKDEKGKSDTPQERGQVTFYEDIGGPLYQNCFLFNLVIILARKPFRDYDSPNWLETYLGLLNIKVDETQRFQKIYWKTRFRDEPFFESQTKEPGNIEKAGGFHRRHKDSCYRAGMPNAPNLHDFRRESLNNADQKHSQSARMRLAGHIDSRIFRKHYQPREVIDGPANFLGREQRTDILEVSRQLNIPYIPNLLQSLPAKELYELRNGKKYKAIEEQIEKEPCARKAGRLKYRLTSLSMERLRRLRAKQAYDHPPSYEHEIYSRVRFMLPERRRLETNLFEEVPLRSATGIQVVKDLVALYLRDKEVEFRPGLEPTLCSCSKSSYDYDWKHILKCHKASQVKIYGFAQLCFLCNIWIYKEDEWEKHCEGHVNNTATFPVWVDPLMYNGVLAVAGFCEFCLIDPRLPASQRMYQWTWRQAWQEHYQLHYRDPRFERKCRHQSFPSLLELQFHLHDCHGVPMPELSRQRRKRREQETEESYPARSPKRPRTHKKDEPEEELALLDDTVDSFTLSVVERCSPKSSPRLLPSDTEFGASQMLQSKCSSYPDIDLLDSNTTSGPYYSGCDVPEMNYSEKEFSSQLAPSTDPISAVEAEFIDIADYDSACEIESASTEKRITEEQEVVDLSSRGNASGSKSMIDTTTIDPTLVRDDSIMAAFNDDSASGAGDIPNGAEDIPNGAGDIPIAGATKTHLGELDIDLGELDIEIDSEGEEIYETEAILDHDMIDGIPYYKVKWKGYPDSENTWEPLSNLEGSWEMVKGFHQRKRVGPRRRKQRQG